MGFFYGFDWTYLVFIVPCIIITLICQIKVQSTFSEYSKIRKHRRKNYDPRKIFTAGP